MRIVAAGASGMIGEPLVRWWRAAGHDVVRLVRRAPTAPGEVQWDPSSGRLDPAALGRVDAAVNLAGAGVGDQRWDEEWKRTIVESRTSSTALLARTLAQLDAPPAVLLQGSASGFYGSPGEELLDESAPAGEEFLARACVAWEAAAAPARAAGIRTVSLRTGLVMAPEGGAFGQLLPLVKLGLGGPLGDGRSWWSWITLEDELRAIDHLLHADVSGPVNLVAPDAERNRTLITALAKAHHRPSVLPVPAFALRAVVGEFAEEILASRRLAPTALLASGFRFSHPDVASAVRWTRAVGAAH